MLKIRLRRMGAIRQPHYRIVVADARAPRDGAFLETLGSYNPLTNPSTINIDIAKYEEWKSKGAQPTDAVASLVKHYNRAVRLGTQAATPLTKKAERAQAAAARDAAAQAALATADVAETADAPVDVTEGPEGPMAPTAQAGGDVNIDPEAPQISTLATDIVIPEGVSGLEAGTGTGPGGQTGDVSGNTGHHG